MYPISNPSDFPVGLIAGVLTFKIQIRFGFIPTVFHPWKQWTGTTTLNMCWKG